MVFDSAGLPGHPGYNPPGLRPDVQAYKSPHGPKYTIGRNFHGFNSASLLRVSKQAALFGMAGGVALLFFASDVPRVRIDIMQRIPIIGPYWKKEVPPEDDPF